MEFAVVFGGVRYVLYVQRVSIKRLWWWRTSEILAFVREGDEPFHPDAFVFDKAPSDITTDQLVQMVYGLVESDAIKFVDDSHTDPTLATSSRLIAKAYGAMMNHTPEHQEQTARSIYHLLA